MRPSAGLRRSTVLTYMRRRSKPGEVKAAVAHALKVGYVSRRDVTPSGKETQPDSHLTESFCRDTLTVHTYMAT